MGIPGGPNPLLMRRAAVAAADDDDDSYKIERSLRFEDASDANLKKTIATKGDRRRWTYACWLKNCLDNGGWWLIGKGNTYFQVVVDGTQSWIRCNQRTNGGNTWWDSGRKINDPGAWYHVVIAVDYTQTTNADKIKLYINGVLDPAAAGQLGKNYVSTYTELLINQAGDHYIGSNSNPGGGGGYLADIYFIDGQQLSPAAFGSFNSLGVWSPASFSLPSPNNGTTWSNDGDDTNMNSSYPWSKAFDGITDGTYQNGAGADDGDGWARWTPTDGITVKASLRLNTDNGTSAVKVKFSSGTITSVQHLIELTDGWNDVEGTGTLEYIEIFNQSSNWSYLCGIEIDGVVLRDGHKDPTARKNLNDGTVWSNYLVSSTGAFYGSMPASQGFDGHTGNSAADASSSGATMTWTPPSVITFTGSVELWAGGAQGGDQTITITDASDATTSAVTTVTDWYTIKSGGGTLKSLALAASSGVYASWYALRIDGQVLIDSTVDNSFGLNFSDVSSNSALGKDTLKKISDCNGGLPIYNTDDYGDVKKSGYRTDNKPGGSGGNAAGTTNNTGLVLAVPGDSVASGTCDVHQAINVGSSNKAVTLIGDPSVDTSKSRLYGSSIAFDGSDALSFAADADFDWGTYSSGTDGDFTLECFVNFTSMGASGSLADFVDNDANNSPGGGWYYGTSRGLEWYLGGSYVPIAPSYFTAGHWHHVALVRTGGVLKHYLDGVLKASGSFTGQCGISSKAFKIGNFSSIYFTGSLQDFRVYKGVAKYTADFIAPNRNTPWTVNNLNHDDGTVTVANADLKPIFETTGDQGGTKKSPEAFNTDSNSSYLKLAVPGEGPCTDKSADIHGSGSNQTTSVNSATEHTGTSRFYGKCMDFDGSNDFFTVGSSADFKFGTGEWTVEYWINIDDITQDGLIVGTINEWNNGSEYVNLWGANIQQHAGSSKTRFLFSPAGSTPLNYVLSATADQGQWVHWAWQRTGNTLQAYRNGVLVDSASTSHNNSNQQVLRVGQTDDLGYINAKLNDLRIYNGVAKYSSSGFNVPQIGSVTGGIDALLDSPTSYGTDNGAGGEVRANYATMNPLAADTGWTYSEGNLKCVSTGNYGATKSSIGMTSGKWYCEARQLGTGSANGVGVVRYDHGNDWFGSTSTEYAYGYLNDGRKVTVNQSRTTYGATYTEDDVIGIALDLSGSTGSVTFYKNGSSQGQAYTFTTADGPYFFSQVDDSSGSNSEMVWNFGQRAFKHTAPTGHKCLCTHSLDDTFSGAAVNNPSKFFDIKTYIGTGASLDIKGVGFQPDLVWIKSRVATYDHASFDKIRGENKRLRVNKSDQEGTDTQTLTSFNSDGYTTGTDEVTNKSDDTYVAWMWDAGTSAGSNNDGSINVSSGQMVNTTCGFSITHYTGDGATDGTVGHGLGVTPAMVWIKKVNGSGEWKVWIKGMDAAAGKMLTLSQNYAEGVSSWQAPTSTLIKPATSGDQYLNASGSTYVAYCWAPITGHSAFGKYNGNSSSTAGGFIYLGFRPAFLMIKNVTGYTEHWLLWDKERNTYNTTDNYMYPNLNNIEADDYYPIDMLSNGFKLRNSSAGTNGSSGTYVYAAFAEHPQKTALAR